MANRNKHRARSQYSYHNKPDFTDFERKANMKQIQKASQNSSAGLLGRLLGKLKQAYHRMTSK